MAVVSKTSILNLIENKDIVVYPQDNLKIGNCSIDVRLGQWFFRQQTDYQHLPVYPYTDAGDSVIKYTLPHPWIPTPQKASPEGINQDTPLISIDPGETILVTTEEFIGSRLECTTLAKTKSTLTRLGIDVVSSAGWGDIGFINRWAFPLHNRSKRTVLLKPGTWIAQIVFLKVTDKEISYSQSGNYQSSDNLVTLIENWDPMSVLPKPLSFSPLDS